MQSASAAEGVGTPLIEALLDEVLEFYGSRGVTLGYRPTVEQVDTDSQLEMRQVARIGREVPATLPDRPSLSRLFARQRSAELWRSLYSLEVSSAAIEELDAVVRLRGEVRAPLSHSGDILLFSPFAWARSRTWYLAHEVWHLVEAERDLLREYEPIREGTATFAAAVCLGRPEGERYLQPPEACTDIVSLRRTGVASIVAEALDRGGLPLRALLRREVRERLQDEAVRRCTPRVLALADRAAADPEYVEDFRRYLRRALARLRVSRPLTPRQIVAAFQLVGAPGLANELSGQDLAALEADLREHGLVLATVEQREIG
jgi:hypothetical protein